VDEGGTMAGAPNILENDVDPQADILIPSIVEPPLRASFFELAPTGTFDYVHDGSETLSDSFTYRVSDGINESDVATVSLTITPVNDRPEIRLIGGPAIEVIGGDAFSDPGATAQDAEDGDISASIVVGGDSLNTDVEAIYILTYDVADSEGLDATQVTRTVNVTIDDPPVITLIGPAELTLTVGDSYTEQGASAQDPEDGDVSDNIVISGDAVNAAVIGTYIVTYDATDTTGNQAAQLTRTVVVNAPPFVPSPVQITGGGGGFLSFWETISLALLGLFSKLARRQKNWGRTESIDTPATLAGR
jgi:hypothetical protein